MDLSREEIVRDVLERVNDATVAELRRGPRVVFSESGEIGDDQGGLTREMFAEFARGLLEEGTKTRLLQSTQQNRAFPAYYGGQKDPRTPIRCVNFRTSSMRL